MTRSCSFSPRDLLTHPADVAHEIAVTQKGGDESRRGERVRLCAVGDPTPLRLGSASAAAGVAAGRRGSTPSPVARCDGRGLMRLVLEGGAGAIPTRPASSTTLTRAHRARSGHVAQRNDSPTRRKQRRRGGAPRRHGSLPGLAPHARAADRCPRGTCSRGPFRFGPAWSQRARGRRPIARR